jgi:hypothetical protein
MLNRGDTWTALLSSYTGAVYFRSCGLVLIVGVMVLFARSDCTGPEGKGSSSVFITYQVGGEQDAYSDGDQYGHRMKLSFDRRYVLSRLTYRTTSDGYALDTTEIGRDRLSPSVFDTLRTCVEALVSDSIPARLPAVDPRDVLIRTPALSVTLEAQSAPSADQMSVRANMGADREHYPSSFLRLHSALNRLLYSRMLPESDS